MSVAAKAGEMQIFSHDFLNSTLNRMPQLNMPVNPRVNLLDTTGLLLENAPNSPITGTGATLAVLPNISYSDSNYESAP